MSGLSVNLTTLFLGRLRPPKRLTSTLCTYFRQKLTTASLESAERDTKVCGQTGYQTQDLWLMSRVPYRLRYAARLEGGMWDLTVLTPDHCPSIFTLDKPIQYGLARNRLFFFHFKHKRPQKRNKLQVKNFLKVTK